MSSETCLICNGNLPSSSPTELNDFESFEVVNFVGENNCVTVPSLSTSSSTSLVNQHVHTIFILKTIFQLPSTRLTKYLQNFPNIEKWITLCSNCEQVVNDCKSIYNELLKIQEKLLASRLNVIKLVKGSYRSDDDQLSGKSQQFNVSQDCRRFLINRKDTELQDNPFITGDNQALDILITQLSSAVKQEEDETFQIKIEDDISPYLEPITFSNIEEDDDDDRQLQNQPISEQIPFSDNDHSNDWQPNPSSSDSDPLSGSDSDYSPRTPEAPPIKSKRPKVHQRKYKSSSKYQCSICNKTLSRLHHLRRHTATQHNIGFRKKYPCNMPNCSGSFQDSHKLALHKRGVHKIEIVYKCRRRRHCDKEFLDQKSREKHENLHKRGPTHIPFACYLCPVTFSAKADLIIHKAEVHHLPQRLYRPLKSSIRPPKTTTSLNRRSTSSKHKCSICHQIQSGPLSLRRHVALRHNIGFQKRYPCNIPGCSKVFKDSHKLSLHKNTKHDKLALHKCRHCEKGFFNRKSRKTHENLHKTDPSHLPFPCYLCPDGFTTKAALALHKVEVHKLPQPKSRSLDKDSADHTETSKPYQCPLCRSKYKSEGGLRRHLKGAHNKKSASSLKPPKPPRHHCPLCPSKFTLIKGLNRHLEFVHDQEPIWTISTSDPSKPKETPHHCTLCPSKFTVFMNLQRHLQKIHNQKVTLRKKITTFETPQHCPLCPFKFVSAENLNRHLLKIHNHHQDSLTEKSFLCTQCPRKFTTHGNLRKHCRMLHKVELEAPPAPPATCETCGLIFKNRDSMKSHQYISPTCRPLYLKVKPAKDTSAVCEVCGVKFTNKHSMLNHVKHVHEKKYEFICDKCPGKGYQKEYDFKLHLFSKHGEGREEDFKKWLCSEEGCGKRWETEKDLKYHLDWHKGIKGFICEECGKGFYRPNYLSIHKKNVHGWKGKKWKCELCKNEYKSEENMRIHLERFHYSKKGKKKRKEVDNNYN